MEEIINGLKSIKNFLNGRYHKGLHDQVIEECEDEEYKICARNINLASELYKADMEVLEDAIKHLKAEDTTNRKAENEGNKIMNISFQTLDSVSCMVINGFEIPNVKDYKITTSASGETEVVIKIVFDSEIKVGDLSTN